MKREIQYPDVEDKMEIEFQDKNGNSIVVNTGTPIELTMKFRFKGEEKVMQIPTYDIYARICKPNRPFMISE